MRSEMRKISYGRWQAVKGRQQLYNFVCIFFFHFEGRLECVQMAMRALFSPLRDSFSLKRKKAVANKKKKKTG